MPWFKVDDGFHGHPKVLELALPSVGLWTLAGSWCASYLTDGEITLKAIGRLGASKKEATDLVKAGLWNETEPGTYQFKDWADYQPLKAAIEAERDAARERMKTVRSSKKGTNKPSRSAEHIPNVQPNNTGTFADDSEEVRVAPSHPDPTRPIKTEKTPSTAAPSKDFNEFWMSYPRKVGKQAAIKAYSKALKMTSPHQILEGVNDLRLQVAGKDVQFTPHPSTWLNEGRWEDEAPQQQVVNGPWSKDFHKPIQGYDDE